MAYLITKDDKKLCISRQQGLFLWKALRDPTNLDEATLTRIGKIKALYLDWHTAPDDYIQENLSGIIPMALNDWIVSRAGKPKKPQSNQAWKFARRWGLWNQGGPTQLVANPAFLTQTTLAGSLPVNDR